MDTTIDIGLSGHDVRFRLEQDAYERLARYLDQAASRLHADPGREEVMADLERSVGDKLAVLPGSRDRLVGTADIEAVLEAIGAVDTGDDRADDGAQVRPRARRLQRIREGQQLAGVCNGLAAYAELRVDWVRTGFVLATVVTAGLFALIYVALAFILPVVPTRER